jgi:hypothetical protein
MARCAHLIVDHKREMIEADVLLVKYVDLTKPIPERRIDAAQVRDRRAVRIRPYSASGKLQPASIKCSCSVRSSA